MTFEETPLAGAFVISPTPLRDNRGFFARLYCAETFAAQGLNASLAQISMSHNMQPGTLRGLHLQRPPFAEAKLVRVTAGTIFDVIVDVRAGSATYGKWFGVELSAWNGKQLYIPEGFAHGFQTLAANTDVLYHISAPYKPELTAGICWDDPDLAIRWPSPGTVILSERDAGLGSFAAFEPVTLAASS